MSRIAIQYAKSLVRAPDGSKITATEKAVLLILADWHNEGLGVAWPSIALLAESSGISERHCRRMVTRLVRKRVLQRRAMQREESGSQTSNDYIFLELDNPKPTPQMAEIRRKTQHVARIPMSETPRPSRPPNAVSSVRVPETHVSCPPGHGSPPIEPLGGTVIESSKEHLEETPSPQPNGMVRVNQISTKKFPKTLPMKTMQNPFTDLGLAQSFWDQAIETIRKSQGGKELKVFRFKDACVIHSVQDAAGNVLLTLRSPKPETTMRGIEKHGAIIVRKLKGSYGRDVRLIVRGVE